MKKLTASSSLLMATIVMTGCARHSGDVASLSLGNPPIFETRVEIDTGTSTHSDFHVADFDGDGLLDMAIISLTGEFQVMIGNGSSFVPGQSVQINGLPIWMTGGDFDNDGDEDLVIVRNDVDETNVWLNDGSGTFQMAGTLAGAGTGALAVAVGDLNNDGMLDVAVSMPQALTVVVGFGDSLGGFLAQVPVTVSGTGSAFNIAIGDSNRDQYDDLVVADPVTSRLVVFPGGLIAEFGSDVCELLVPGSPASVTFGDMTGDGLDDMVTSAYSDNHYEVITNVLPPVMPLGSSGRDLSFCDYESFRIDVPGDSGIASIGDVTGDGINDLVGCLGGTASVCVIPGAPMGQISEMFLLDTTGLPLRPFIGDFDKNNRDDLFVLSGYGSRVNLWLSSGEGRLAGARSYSSGLPESPWLEGADLDGDGDFELITGSPADTKLSILGGDGVLLAEDFFDVGFPVSQLCAQDLDADGKVDLVVGVSGGIRVLRNTSLPGDYSFELVPVAPIVMGSADYPFGIEVGDFDLDGDQDIVLCDFTGGGVHLLPGTPNAFVFDPEIIISTGGGPLDVVAADFTGDGLPDFAVSRTGQADIAILRNEGNNAYVESLAVPVGLSPNYLVTSDFNSDGRADLVVSNANSGTVSVLFGNATGFSGNDFVAGAAPTALMAKDLTGDGQVDILVSSLLSGDFKVMVGDGDGGFPLLPTFPGTLGASDVVMQDMTGDGKSDLIVSSLISNRLSLVENISQ